MLPAVSSGQSMFPPWTPGVEVRMTSSAGAVPILPIIGRTGILIASSKWTTPSRIATIRPA